MALRMTVLCEDQARMGFLDKKYSGQHGLSILIEAHKKILFDVGPSGVFLENARLAGALLDDLDWVVLSHGHWDHTDGLEALAASGLRPKLLAHPQVFADRHKASGEFNGMAMSRERAAALFPLTESEEPVQLAPDIWFLGQIPRTNDFESKRTTFFQMVDGRKEPDFLLDDTALALCRPEGLVVVTGCSHAGICNICEHAKSVTNVRNLHMVIGGFHLLEDSPVVDKTIAYFTQQNVERLYPMHCTALPALARLWQTFGIKKFCAGDVLELD